MIDLQAIKVALRGRLTADATLMALVGGVFNLYIPATVTWSKPCLEYGVQAMTEDREGASYTQRAEDVRIRLMAHDKGDAPGVGSLADAYAALRRAETTLLATPFTTGGTWFCRYVDGIPETSQSDDAGYPRMSVGRIYRLRVIE